MMVCGLPRDSKARKAEQWAPLGLSVILEHVYGIHRQAPYVSGEWLTTFAHVNTHPATRKKP